MDLSALDERTNALLVDVIEAFTDDPMRTASATTFAQEFGATTEEAATALHILEGFGILEAVHVRGETSPTYRFRVAATFLDVLERVAAVYAERLGPLGGGEDDHRVLRARLASLDAKNALQAKKISELSFLIDTADALNSTLDQSAIAQKLLRSVRGATNGKAKRWFLVLRDGNALVCYCGAGVEHDEADAFVDAHHDAIERSLRTGQILSEPLGFVAVPVPAGPHEPDSGSIVILDAGDEGLDAIDLQRLSQLADIGGRSLSNARLFAQSIAAGITDELTGVYNRRYLARRLGDELKRARRLGERFSLILLDLDFFKTVNDEHGHPEGDRVLRGVAQTIAATVRDIDVVTRWGGEEFAVVLPGADGPEAIAIAERVRESVEALRLKTASGKTVRMTISCGVAWTAPHIHTPAQCLAEADRRLLEAKRTGRNKTVSM